MRRWTARLLCVIALLGTLAPVALAISGPTPHACCMRKMHARASAEDSFQSAASAEDHSCCSLITVELWAETAQTSRIDIGFATAPSVPAPPSVLRTVGFNSADPVRGPPASSIA